MLEQNTSTGNYIFANTETGVRFRKESKTFDFRLWQNEKAGYAKCLLDKIGLADGCKLILSTGNTNWVDDHV